MDLTIYVRSLARSHGHSVQLDLVPFVQPLVSLPGSVTNIAVDLDPPDYQFLFGSGLETVDKL